MTDFSPVPSETFFNIYCIGIHLDINDNTIQFWINLETYKIPDYI
jgi:hypothetical protein